MQANPIVAALMAKMKIAPRDRPKVKLECLRLLATLRLDPAKSEMIGGFIEGYLKLTAEENKRYERAFAQLADENKETTVEMRTSWGREGMEKGLQQGLHKGKEDLLARQIRRRFGAVAPEVTECLGKLASDELDELGEALFDFTSLTELETWLARHSWVGELPWCRS